MKTIWRILIFCSLAFVLASHAVAGPLVERVDSEFDKGDFVAQLTFSQDIVNEALTVDFINETVQVNIPNASVKNGKILKRLRKNNVKSIYVYQFQPNLLRVRIIFDGIAASSLKESVQLQSEGKHLRIVTTLQTNLAQKSKGNSKSKPVLDTIKIKPQSMVVSDNKLKMKPEEVIAEEIKFSAPAVTVKAEGKDIPESQIPINLKAESKSEKSKDASLRNIVYSVLILLAFGILGFIYLKLFQKNGKMANKHTSIKMLTQHHLGPKKSLAIIQVAGESILIGVTDHNISLIRTLSLLDEEVPEVSTENFDQMVDANEPLPDLASAPGSGGVANPVYGRSGVPTSFAEADDLEEREDFSVNSIKDLVKNKISGLREIR